jgi:spore maturation protein CgeB
MSIEKIYDAALIGLHYENRTKLVQALRHKGRNVLYELGLVWDEYRVENNHARVGLNWSSLQDINARTFEIMAMKQIPVMNRLPHLQELGLEENRHYLGFETVEEAVEKVDWALNSPKEAEAIAIVAHNLVHEKHTYDLRIQQIFDEVGL